MEKTKTMFKFGFRQWFWIVLHARQVYWSNLANNVEGTIDRRISKKTESKK